MAETSGLRFGPIGRTAAHVCVDMQRLFSDKTPWHTPWMERVLPAVERLARAHPERTIYTRFIPPHQVAEARGAWRRYWERWKDLTTERLPKELLELAPPLDALARQGGVVLDKRTYSPWMGGRLQSLLERRGIDTLIFSGAETDVCVLAAILGAVDRGYRVIVASDAHCRMTRWSRSTTAGMGSRSRRRSPARSSRPGHNRRRNRAHTITVLTATLCHDCRLASG